MSVLHACQIRESEADGEVASRWRPTESARIDGVAADSVRDAIARRLGDPAPELLSPHKWAHVRGLYKSQAGAPIWLDAHGLDRSRTRPLLDAVADVEQDGIRYDQLPIDETVSALQALRDESSPSAAALANADVMLSALYTSLAEDLLSGQVDPRTVSQSWHIDPRDDRVDSLLSRTLLAGRLESALAQFRPQDPVYDSLRRELVKYRELVEEGGWPQVPAGRALSPGDTAPAARLIALRGRLRAEKLLPEEAGDRPVTTPRVPYDSTLAGAVARFQELHGIVVDSVLGRETLASLNRPAAYRRGQIAANLERFRWLPRLMGARYIVVNVPAFDLQAFDTGHVVLDMKVIVGAEYSGRRTPTFADSMQYVVFRPYWVVPERIAANEIYPKAESDPQYLSRNGYESAIIDRKSRIRQRPGPGNALGLVKFMFPNEFSIYLHDTPSVELFEKDVRAFSHGCIRVEHPVELAQFVLGWPADSVRSQMENGRDDHRVNLPAKIPVYIVYFTTFVRDGALVFGNDLYERDDDLVQAVDAGAPPTAEEIAAISLLRKLGGG